MTVYFVTPHESAVEWAKAQGIKAKHVLHLDPIELRRGDIVMVTLPVSIAANVCKRVARYLHLSLNIPIDYRGRELSPEQMQEFGASLQGYLVQEVQ